MCAAPSVKNGGVDTLNQFSGWLVAHGFSHRTVEARVSFLRRFTADLGFGYDPEPHDVAVYLAQFQGWTRNTYRSHLASFFTWRLETGQGTRNPVSEIKRVRNPDPRPHPLTELEVRRIRVAATDKQRAMLDLGLLAGLRCHEIAKFSGLHITESAIRVAGKGGRVDHLPTHPELWRLAQDFPRDRPWFPAQADRLRLDPDACMRPTSVGLSIGALFDRLGLEGSIHRTRHTYGTNLVRAGAPMHVVQRLMRHTSLSTTQLYLGTDQDELAEAIGRLGRAA